MEQLWKLAIRVLDWQSGGSDPNSAGLLTKYVMFGLSVLTGKIIGWTRQLRSLSNPALWVFRIVFVFSVSSPIENF